MSCSSGELVRAEHLGKSYRNGFWHRRAEHEALHDVSFSLNRGECLGIIGRNGAGKSTLLQILNGSCAPDRGSLAVRGKISALLELGFGFHPDFTGRENILLAGLMLGLTRREISAKTESIIAFADIGDYIDRPLKQYSSGMFVRLAFAVSAHADADIMLIDEALAVGDVFFQQKCYRHLEAVLPRTAVVLVTHDLNAVSTLCTGALVLDRGRDIFQGDVKTAIECYTHTLYDHDASAVPSPDHAARKGQVCEIPAEKCTGTGARFLTLELSATALAPGDRLRVGGTIDLRKVSSELLFGYFFSDRFGKRIFGDTSCVSGTCGTGCHRFSFELIWPEVAPGDYTLTLGVGRGPDIMSQEVLSWAMDVTRISAHLRTGIVHGVFNLHMNNVKLEFGQ